MMTRFRQILSGQFKIRNGKKPAQGVIEYAGALIIAALIISTVVVVIGLGGMKKVYNTVFNGVQNYFNTQAANL